MNESNLTPKQELEKILSTTDISKIDRIEFFPANATMFSSKNENIMKIAVYISTSLGKKSFEPGELKNAFEFVVSNLDSHLPRDEFSTISNALLAFINSGGSIHIIEKGLLASTLDETKKAPVQPQSQNTLPTSLGNVGNKQQLQTQPLNTNHQSNTNPYQGVTMIQKEKIMTWKNILMGLFVLGPISAIINGLIIYPLKIISSFTGTQNIFATFIGLISMVITPIVFVLLSERILHLSRKGSIILFIILSIISIGIFAAVCGGIILIF